MSEATYTVTDSTGTHPNQTSGWVRGDLTPSGRKKFDAWVKAGGRGTINLGDPGLPLKIKKVGSKGRKKPARKNPDDLEITQKNGKYVVSTWTWMPNRMGEENLTEVTLDTFKTRKQAEDYVHELYSEANPRGKKGKKMARRRNPETMQEAMAIAEASATDEEFYVVYDDESDAYIVVAASRFLSDPAYYMAYQTADIVEMVEPNPAFCAPGSIEISRKSYKRKDGTKVPATVFCQIDRGRPGARAPHLALRGGHRRRQHRDGRVVRRDAPHPPLALALQRRRGGRELRS